MKVIILYKSAIDSNKFLFDTTEPKIGHSQVGQARVASAYVQVVAQYVLPVRTKNNVSNQYF